MAESDLLQELHLEDAQRQPRGWRWSWLLPVGVVVVLLVAAAGYLRSVRPPTVEVIEASLPASGLTSVLDATGYVVARREATVSSKISGKLFEVLIEEGQQVGKGDVMARLDDTDARAGLQLAEARLEAERAKLGQIRVQLEQAKRDLRRQDALHARKLASQESVENASTQVETLTAQLAAQDSQVRVAEAQVQVAQVDHDNTIVRAPFSGVVVAKTAQPGEIVSPISAGGGYTRTGIGTVVDMDSLEIEVDVNEAFINRVRPGQPVQAVLDAYPDWQIPASVIAIVPTADRSKATVKVRVAIGVKDPRLLPEMGARVSFQEDLSGDEGAHDGAVLVPRTALRTSDDGSSVFVLAGTRVRQRLVQVGEFVADQVLIRGIAPQTPVVRDPAPQLNDGAEVLIHQGS